MVPPQPTRLCDLIASPTVWAPTSGVDKLSRSTIIKEVNNLQTSLSSSSGRRLETRSRALKGRFNHPPLAQN